MLIVLDVAVGVAFCGVGLAATGLATGIRVWWVAVAASWWLGAVPGLSTVHQAVLAAALVCVPTGAPVGRRGLGALAASVALTASGLGQAVAATGFAVAGLGSRTGYARLAAGALATALAAMWTWSRVLPGSYRPDATLAAYDALLLAIAIALPWGVRAHGRLRAARVEQLLATGPVGIRGLESALRSVLRDDALVLEPVGDRYEVRTRRRLDDETADAVQRAIRLTLEHQQVQASLAEQIAELEAARRRLLHSADRERSRAIAGLGRDLARLRAAQDDARHVPMVADELGRAARDIESIVAGTPPMDLGNGAIRKALEDLAHRHPHEVVLDVDPAAAGDVLAETAIFYAASEALANTAKHAGAADVRIRLRGGDELVLQVEDDGVGGVEHRGAGLRGLADRLNTYDGELLVSCAPGAGTRVVARVPASVAMSVDAHPGLQ